MRAKGFTLIELMIVVAIIGILATLAVPSYQDMVIKKQVQEGVEFVGFAKQAVAEYYSKRHALPANNAAAGLPPREKIIGSFVTLVEVENGAITITYGNRVNKNIVGKKLTLRPAYVADAQTVPISWVCGAAHVPDGLKTVKTNNTDFPISFLPLDCLG